MGPLIPVSVMGTSLPAGYRGATPFWNASWTDGVPPAKCLSHWTSQKASPESQWPLWGSSEILKLVCSHAQLETQTREQAEWEALFLWCLEAPEQLPDADSLTPPSSLCLAETAFRGISLYHGTFTLYKLPTSSFLGNSSCLCRQTLWSLLLCLYNKMD